MPGYSIKREKSVCNEFVNLWIGENWKYFANQIAERIVVVSWVIGPNAKWMKWTSDRESETQTSQYEWQKE